MGTRKRKTKPQHRRRPWLGVAFVTLLAASAVSAVFWPRSEPPDAAHQMASDVYYVNNRECAMSDSPIAEKDLGRFQSRVVYDGPIERFQGKTLVFNQCCAMCIESFPKKWAAERDQIMEKFVLAGTR